MSRAAELPLIEATPGYWLRRINGYFFNRPTRADAKQWRRRYRKLLSRAGELLDDPPPDLSGRAMDALRRMEDAMRSELRTLSRVTEDHLHPAEAQLAVDAWLLAVWEMLCDKGE